MPSISVDLGRYVTVRPRKDGTARVLFEIPKRLRPSGWSAAIPLPIDGERRGDLSDMGEVARIQADAKTLYVRLQQDKIAAHRPPPPGRTFRTLVETMEGSQGFKRCKPRTQQGYSYHTRYVTAWSASVGDPDPTKLTKPRIEQFLALFDDRPTTRRHVKIVLKMLMDQAVNLGWRQDNPVAKIKMGQPKSRVTIWEQEDVDAYVSACEDAGQANIAALILTQWEIGQRLTDVRLFQYRRQYEPVEGVFRFWQEKTESYVTIPISPKLRSLLGTGHNQLYLFLDSTTEKPFAEQRLGHVFGAIREAMVAAELGRRLVLRALRHSCVVQLARCGCTVPQIASITGHKIGSVEQILSTYLPRDNEVAWEAQARRGLVARRNGAGTDV